MNRRGIYILSLIGIYFCSSSFQRCGCIDEFRSLSVNFNNKGYSKVKVKGSSTFVVNNTSPSNYFPLRYDLSTTSVSYVFMEGAVSDTLTVSYTPEFYFRSKDCGYDWRIKDLEIIPPTTFKKYSLNGYHITIDD